MISTLLVGKARWIAAAAAVAAVVGLYALVTTSAYNRGHDAATATYSAAVAAERERWEAANKAATDRGREEALKLAKQLEEATNALDRLKLEADNDPDADNRAIGVDSVRRLNGACGSTDGPC